MDTQDIIDDGLKKLFPLFYFLGYKKIEDCKRTHCCSLKDRLLINFFENCYNILDLPNTLGWITTNRKYCLSSFICSNTNSKVEYAYREYRLNVKKNNLFYNIIKQFNEENEIRDFVLSIKTFLEIFEMTTNVYKVYVNALEDLKELDKFDIVKNDQQLHSSESETDEENDPKNTINVCFYNKYSE